MQFINLNLEGICFMNHALCGCVYFSNKPRYSFIIGVVVWFLIHVSSAWAIYFFMDCVCHSTMASTYKLNNYITQLILDREYKPNWFYFAFIFACLCRTLVGQSWFICVVVVLFSCWPLHCLSIDSRLQITPLVSSNFSDTHHVFL
jgi:hypothetical protein